MSNYLFIVTAAERDRLTNDSAMRQHTTAVSVNASAHSLMCTFTITKLVMGMVNTLVICSETENGGVTKNLENE